MLLEYFAFLLLVFVLACIIIPFTVLIHELGHAIPAILFTKESCTIFIGSYGDSSKSWKLKTRILSIFIKKNPFLWNRGMCHHSEKNLTRLRHIVIILGGVLFTLALAVIAIYLSFAYELHGFLKLIAILFLSASILALVVNLIPSKKFRPLPGGKYFFNDGYLITRVLHFDELKQLHAEAEKLVGEEKYAQALEKYFRLSELAPEHAPYLRKIISLNFLCKNFDEVQKETENLRSKFSLGAQDLFYVAMAQLNLHSYEEAIHSFDEAVNLEPNNYLFYHNRGYTYNLMEKFTEAISDFDRTIQLTPSMAYAYNNRGYAKIKSGKAEDGLTDIQKSLELDGKNAYAFRNLGIYYLEKNENKKAFMNFMDAFKMDSETPLIRELLTEAKNRIENISR